jgi:hypothetical protein
MEALPPLDNAPLTFTGVGGFVSCLSSIKTAQSKMPFM